MASCFARELTNEGLTVLLVAQTNSATDHLALVSKELGVDVVRHYSKNVAPESRSPSLKTSEASDLKLAKCVATTAAATGHAEIRQLMFDYVFLDEVKWKFFNPLKICTYNVMFSGQCDDRATGTPSIEQSQEGIYHGR